MAEFLIYNKDHWMSELSSQEIDAYRERAADNYTKWRDAKITLTLEEIDAILFPLVVEAKEDWIAKHNEVLNMTEDDIDIAREKARVMFLEKYDARSQMGDVVEVRPDGYWTGTKAKNYNKSAFLLVTVPGLSFKDAQQYGNRLRGENGKILRKHRYNFGSLVDKQVFNNILEITIRDKNV